MIPDKKNNPMNKNIFWVARGGDGGSGGAVWLCPGGNGPGVVRRTININNAETAAPAVYETNSVFNYINSDFIKLWNF